MLGKLFGSNSRVKILKFFLLHPKEKYYIRQLSRDLKLQVNSVRRELENLEEFGILISRLSAAGGEEENNKDAGQEKKYYKVNSNFILFEEIKSLIVKAQVLYGKDFVRGLKKIGKPKLFILTGVFINNLDSPTDILIVGKFNKIKLRRLLKNLEKDLCREINYTLMDAKEFKYRKEMTDVFLYKILEGNKIVIINEIGAI
jgi:hypothetical protein